MRGATIVKTNQAMTLNISTHAPHAGSDGKCRFSRAIGHNFNPRSPCGERLKASRNWQRLSNFNPRSPCGERPALNSSRFSLVVFQPTLPMRGATRRAKRLAGIENISTHAPHAGSDVVVVVLNQQYSVFQPTLPMRGATYRKVTAFGGLPFQPTLPMRGATKRRHSLPLSRRFQPTLPMRGATCHMVALL